MGSDSFNVLSLCSGGGGLDRGISLAIPNARVVCCVEHEAYAIEILASQMENGYLDDAPIWTDLRSFDGKPWRGVVDIIVGGYPCQPFSVAGKRAGTDDPRHLWPHIARIVSEVEPSIVFCENVPGHLILGFEAVRDELQGLGYRVAAGLFSAEEIGATHRRERLFIMARRNQSDMGNACAIRCGGHYTNGGREGGSLENRRLQEPQGGCGELGFANSDRARQGRGSCFTKTERENGRRLPGRSSADVEDSSGVGRRGRDHGLGTCGEGGLRCESQVARPVGALADAECFERTARQTIRRSTCESRSESDRGVEPCEYSTFPPAPNDREGWMRLLETDPSLEPAICVCADGMADRADQLRVLGNGVVPLCAAYAFLSLYACLREGIA